MYINFKRLAILDRKIKKAWDMPPASAQEALYQDANRPAEVRQVEQTDSSSSENSLIAQKINGMHSEIASFLTEISKDSAENRKYSETRMYILGELRDLIGKTKNMLLNGSKFLSEKQKALLSSDLKMLEKWYSYYSNVPRE